MKRKNLKIIVSSFIVGIIILTIGLFANQSSDITFLGDGQNNLANVSGFLNQPPQGDFAQEEQETGYKTISGIDFDPVDVGGKESNFIGLMRTIFNWLIAIVVIATTLSVIVGAVQYMTTDAISGKQDGKERMTSAIAGLILALMSWLILYTINEDIFTKNFLARFSEETSGETNPGANEGNVVAEEEKTNEEIVAENNERIEFIEDLLPFAANEISQLQIKRSTCFDADGNFIDPPTDTDLCGGATKILGSSRIDATIEAGMEELRKQRQELNDLKKQNQELSNNENYTNDESDSSNDSTIGDETSTSDTQEEETITYEEFMERFGNQNNSTEVNQGDTQSNNSGMNNEAKENLITYEEFVNRYLNPNNNGGDTSTERQLEDYERNNIEFQNQTLQNIFINNYENIDMTQASEKIKDTLLTFRDACCGARANINGESQFLYSFNVSDVDTENDSFILERVEMNKFRIRNGPDLWQRANSFIEQNTYPDQNLVEITRYIECRDSNSRRNCRMPENFREIDGRYYSTTRKGVLARDLIPNKEYISYFNNYNSEVIYNNSSWEIKVN